MRGDRADPRGASMPMSISPNAPADSWAIFPNHLPIRCRYVRNIRKSIGPEHSIRPLERHRSSSAWNRRLAPAKWPPTNDTPRPTTPTKTHNEGAPRVPVRKSDIEHPPHTAVVEKGTVRPPYSEIPTDLEFVSIREHKGGDGRAEIRWRLLMAPNSAPRPGSGC